MTSHIKLLYRRRQVRVLRYNKLISRAVFIADAKFTVLFLRMQKISA
jgi:hypothetical protein